MTYRIKRPEIPRLVRIAGLTNLAFSDFEHIVDLRSSAVDKHDADSDKVQKDNIFHYGVEQFFTDHGVAAVFDYDDLAVIL